MNGQAGIRALAGELGKNEIYGDTFSPDGLRWAAEHMVDVAKAIAVQTVPTYIAGLPDVNPGVTQKHVAEATFKTSMFAVALTMGEVKNIDWLVKFGQAVNGMYIPNDLVDRGGEIADRAIAAIDLLLDKDDAAESHEPLVRDLLRAISQTEKHIDMIALPEDRPFVLDRIYRQVLGNEVKMQRFSREYVEAEDKKAFLATYGQEIAEVSTESAGAPSIASGLYAMYRQQDPSLPSLEKVYANQHIVVFDRVLNAVARLWDEVGDRQKDGRGLSGEGPDKGKFMINVFNQPEPALINGYLDLAVIEGERRQKLYDATINFTDDEVNNRAYIIQSLTEHMREYTLAMPAETRAEFEVYLTMGKRVAEIALVNTKGDEILASLGAGAA